jgi:hypothetical protein
VGVPDKAVDEAIAVKLRRVDVVHAQFDRAPEKGIGGRGFVPEPLQLHGAESNAGNAVCA